MKTSLIYHVYADGNRDMLEYNINLIKPYFDAFDDINIKVTYDSMDKVDSIRNLLDNNFDLYKNDPRVGENIGLMTCLEWVNSAGYDAVFIGSTNGVSKTDETIKRNIRAWVRAMIHLSLNNFEFVESIFKKGYNCYGNFKRDTPMEKGGPYPCPWHYSGLFYWLNCKELFKRDWKFLADCRHGIEMYPGYLFDTKEAYCHFNTQQDLYHEELKDEQWVNYIP